MTSLEQGKSFNNTLNKYISSIEDSLQLIQEPFDNQNTTETDIYMKKLKLDNIEDPTVAQLNDKFNRIIVKYISIFNQYNTELLVDSENLNSKLQLLKVNNELVSTAQQLYSRMEEIGRTNKKLENSLKSERKDLYNKIVELKKQQEKLRKKIDSSNTLDASFEDNKRLSDSTNLKYMLFILGSVILALTAIKLN